MARHVILSLIVILSTLSASAAEINNHNPNYDAQLAKKLGADDYGMKSFVFVLLKSGTNDSTDKAAKSAAFRGHLDNINRLVDAKKLIIAGPFGKNEVDFRGLFILDVASAEEASELLKIDPAIQQGYLKVELIPWYGSAALAEYLPAADKVWQLNP